jgi:Protein of unknown function (DUF2490)
MLAALGVLALPARARAEGRLWVTASMTASLAKAWRLNAEVSPRWERDVSEYTRTVLRAQVGRVLPRTLVVWGGFEYNDPVGPLARREDRLWQSLTWTSHVGSWALGQRARLEERFLDRAPSMALRTRYQLRATHAIGANGPWSVIAAGELFVTLRGTRLGPSQGLDRGRLTAGLSRRLTPELSVDVEYFREYIDRPHPVPDQINNTLAARFAMRVPPSVRGSRAD